MLMDTISYQAQQRRLVPSLAKMVICKFDVNANFKSLKSKTDDYGSKKENISLTKLFGIFTTVKSLGT